jgi:hypothetical protein
MTNSVNHRTLVDRLRGSGVRVIVPEVVSVEPPALLSLVGLARPRVDSVVGAVGLAELAFLSGLLDLIAPDHVFVFRPASVNGPRAARDEPTLAPLYRYSDAELAAFDALGWSPRCQYTGEEIVPAGAAEAAAIFAVTDDASVDLAGPAVDGDRARTEGLVFARGTPALRVRVTYALG